MEYGSRKASPDVVKPRAHTHTHTHIYIYIYVRIYCLYLFAGFFVKFVCHL
jgi:hypothetical protein